MGERNSYQPVEPSRRDLFMYGTGLVLFTAASSIVGCDDGGNGGDSSGGDSSHQADPNLGGGIVAPIGETTCTEELANFWKTENGNMIIQPGIAHRTVDSLGNTTVEEGPCP